MHKGSILSLTLNSWEASGARLDHQMGEGTRALGEAGRDRVPSGSGGYCASVRPSHSRAGPPPLDAALPRCGRPETSWSNWKNHSHCRGHEWWLRIPLSISPLFTELIRGFRSIETCLLGFGSWVPAWKGGPDTTAALATRKGCPTQAECNLVSPRPRQLPARVGARWWVVVRLQRLLELVLILLGTSKEGSWVGREPQ